MGTFARGNNHTSAGPGKISEAGTVDTESNDAGGAGAGVQGLEIGGLQRQLKESRVTRTRLRPVCGTSRALPEDRGTEASTCRVLTGTMEDDGGADGKNTGGPVAL